MGRFSGFGSLSGLERAGGVGVASSSADELFELDRRLVFGFLTAGNSGFGRSGNGNGWGWHSFVRRLFVASRIRVRGQCHRLSVNGRRRLEPSVGGKSVGYRFVDLGNNRGVSARLILGDRFIRAKRLVYCDVALSIFLCRLLDNYCVPIVGRSFIRWLRGRRRFRLCRRATGLERLRSATCDFGGSAQALATASKSALAGVLASLQEAGERQAVRWCSNMRRRQRKLARSYQETISRRLASFQP